MVKRPLNGPKMSLNVPPDICWATTGSFSPLVNSKWVEQLWLLSVKKVMNKNIWYLSQKKMFAWCNKWAYNAGKIPGRVSSEHYVVCVSWGAIPAYPAIWGLPHTVLTASQFHSGQIAATSSLPFPIPKSTAPRRFKKKRKLTESSIQMGIPNIIQCYFE